jgi:hypothetical protein
VNARYQSARHTNGKNCALSDRRPRGSFILGSLNDVMAFADLVLKLRDLKNEKKK